MSVIVRRATEQDAHRLAEQMLTDDANEVRAFSGRTPLEALLGAVRGIEDTRVMTQLDDTPICMWGHAPTVDPMIGMIWLLCGEALFRNRAAFLRESKKQIDEFNTYYPVLHNYVDERNQTHVRFLQWNGATFIKRHPHFGVERRPFLEFVRIQCATP
jgi:hypothetical protein